ncbi:MAG: hypothetical protein WEF50_22205 [Myxococcota bacterium]
MFSKTDGPTALRADLVRALSFSHDRIERLNEGGTVASLAALAAVWNGRKGHVALIVRDVEPAAIERYVGSEPILTESELDSAVEEGIAFAESLGFSMDASEFVMLSNDAREERIYRWNKLRKIRPGSQGESSGDSAPSVPELEAAESPPPPLPVPSGYEIELEDLAVPSPPPTPDFEAELVSRAASPDSGSETAARTQNAPSAVLGRISLVRKNGADARRLELIAKLLASY